MAPPSDSTWRRPLPNRLPVRGVDPAHLGRLPGVGEEIVALRIKGKGSVFQDVPVPGRLSAGAPRVEGPPGALKGRRILAPGGIAFADWEFVFAGYSGEPSPTGRSAWRFRAALQSPRGRGDHCAMGCGIPRRQFCSITWERI